MTEPPASTMEQNSQIVEEKKPPVLKPSSYEYLIPETRKLIKKGNFKRAFRMLDTYFGDPKRIGAVQKVQLCRRLMASIVPICTKTLNKPDVHNSDRLLKLLEAGAGYLLHWHNGISEYIAKTNKIMENLNELLVELSGSSDDEEDSQTGSGWFQRRPSRRSSTRTNSQNQSSPPRVSRAKTEKQGSLYMYTLKNQDKTDVSPRGVLESSYNKSDSSRVAEEFKGDELNAQFYLDEFLGYLIKHLLNYALYYKRYNEDSLALKCFGICYKLSKQLEISTNTELLYVCGKARVSVGVFYLEFGRYQEAQTIFESATQVLQAEITLRFNQSNKIITDEEKFMKKLVKTVRMLCMNLLNMAKCCELQLQYAKVIECYKVAHWFAKKIIATDDEFVKTISKCYHRAREEYKSFLEELAECEQVVFDGKDLRQSIDEKNASNKNDQFQKLQEFLYSKFNYHELNKRQLPIKTANNTIISYRGSKSDLPGDETARNDGSETQRNYWRELMSGNASPYRSLNETDTNGAFSHRSRRDRDKKSARKTIIRPSSEGRRSLLSAEKYFESNPEQEINSLQVDTEEELRYEHQLNRNLKRIRPRTGTSMRSQDTSRINKSAATQDTLGFTDIDGFFTNRIEKMIKMREDAKSKPQEFSRILKNYIYYCKNENFDQKEFKYGRGMVNYRKKENLSDSKATYKEILIKHDSREKTQVANDNYYVTAKTQAENYVQARINVSKGSKSPMRPDKTAYTTVGMLIPKKPATVYLESDKSDRDFESRASMSFFANPEDKVKTIAGSGNKGRVRSQSAARTRVAFDSIHSNAEESESGVDPEQFQRTSALVKERISGMMEEIYSEMKDDDYFRKRITANKPLFQQQTVRDRFLKGMSELARSTKSISLKRELSKKPTEESPRRARPDEQKKGFKRVAQNISQRSHSLDPDFSPSKNSSFFPGS